MLRFSSVLWVLNKIHVLLLQETRAWDGEDIRWEGWACFLAPRRPPWLPQRTPSRRRWRTVRKFRRLLRLVWSPGKIIVSNLVCDRGAKPGQGTGCHVNARTVSRHPGTANELWREKIYQVGWTDCWRRHAFSLVLLSPCSWPSHTPLMTVKVRFQGACHREEN